MSRRFALCSRSLLHTEANSRVSTGLRTERGCEKEIKCESPLYVTSVCSLQKVVVTRLSTGRASPSRVLASHGEDVLWEEEVAAVRGKDVI